jgi:hypothetical protein
MSDIHFIYSVSVSACAAAHHSHRILANSRMVKCIYLSICFVGSIRSKPFAVDKRLEQIG